ncbi:MAG: hypothetical protein GXO42_01095 [bacterium]|nr:hypothetical protein [bacterium]
MLLKPSLREKKRYIVVELINNSEDPENIVQRLGKVYGTLGLTLYGISVVKVSRRYLIVRCKHNCVKQTIAGLMLLFGNFIPKVLKVTGTLKKAKQLIR